MPAFIAILVGAAAIVTASSAEYSVYATAFGLASGFTQVLDKLTARPVVRVID